jgi:nitrate reductase assembly molybdenum cofactor insertion protein NarJ
MKMTVTTPKRFEFVRPAIERAVNKVAKDFAKQLRKEMDEQSDIAAARRYVSMFRRRMRAKQI